MLKPWLKRIKRYESESLDRSKYLRLDKNERTIKFENFFLKYLKSKIDTYNLAAYPSLGKIYNLIAKDNKVRKDMVCLTAGSDLAIKTCIEFFTKKNSKVIKLNPTFGMVDVYCDIYNLKKIHIGYDKNLSLNIIKLLKNIKKNISLVIIANPNSPTGTIIKSNILIKIIRKCQKLNVPILIDEAYYGFYKKTYVKYINKFSNLIIIRTFSKSYGLAGLRAGYIIANKKIIKYLMKYKPMYEINSFSTLAIEFLLKNPKIKNNFIKNINQSKIFLISKLKNKLQFINTYANFFHINLGTKKNKIEKIFRRQKILFRKGPGVKGFENYLRISLGSIKQMKKVLYLLHKNI